MDESKKEGEQLPSEENSPQGNKEQDQGEEKKPQGEGSGDASQGTEGEEKTPEGSESQPGPEKKVEGEGDEMVSVKKSDWEDKKKRADDFDKAVELKRILKLNNKDGEEKQPEGEKPVEGEKPAGGGESPNIGDARSKEQTESANEGILKEGYRKFKEEYPWADTDEFFNNISKRFDPKGAATSEVVFKRLETATRETYPQTFERATADKIRNKQLADENAISNGEGGGASAGEKKKESSPTKESADIARKCGNNPQEVHDVKLPGPQ